MFYFIVCVLYVAVCYVFHLANSGKRTTATVFAKFTNACFSGIGAGVSVYFLAQYITSLVN